MSGKSSEDKNLGEKLREGLRMGLKAAFLTVAVGLPAGAFNYYVLSDTEDYKAKYRNISTEVAEAIRWDDSFGRGFEFGLGIGLGVSFFGAASGAKKEDKPEVASNAPRPSGPA